MRILRLVACLALATTGVVNGGEIHDAAATGDLAKVQALLEADPTLLESKDGQGETPLHRACAGRQDAVAELLLGRGATVDARDNSGMTPLLYACRGRSPNYELMQRLVAMGADVNAHLDRGMAALHWVAISDDTRAAGFLIDHGANLNACDKVGYGTVLHMAINFGRSEAMAILLVERGAQPGRRFSFGNTELHLAAMKGYADLARVLVRHGAEVDALNDNNRTALYYAAKLGYRHTAEALLAAGARESSIVEANYGKAAQLAADFEEGEAYLWYLGGLVGGGYAVKTMNHLLVFDPPGIDASPEAGLANGRLNPDELAGQKITVLITKPAALVTERGVLEPGNRIPEADYVTCFQPVFRAGDEHDQSRWHLAAPDASLPLDDIQVHAIPATGRTFSGADAGGLGYLVEADGVRIFHAGFHSAGNRDPELERFRKEIDFLRPFGPINIAILSVRGHVAAAYQPYLYLLDQLAPEAVYLMGSDMAEEYPKCAEVLRARNIPVAYPETGRMVGERFHYVRQLASATSGDYLNQPPPGEQPEVFARGLVSTDHHEHSAPAFSPDGNEVFWSLWPRPDRSNPQVIMTMRRESGVWTTPAAALFSGEFVDGGPVFSPDGARLYFYSTRPTPAGPTRDDIWFVERQGTGWSEPQCLELVARFPELRSVSQPSVARNGTLYFVSRQKDVPPGEFLIWRAEWDNGAYTRPEPLPAGINDPHAYVNWTPFIAPDESYLIFSSGRSPDHGGGDLYLARRAADGTWSEPEMFPGAINTPGQERFPAVSPDGRFLFFTRPTPGHAHDIYWVSTAAIPAQQPKDIPQKERAE